MPSKTASRPAPQQQTTIPPPLSFPRPIFAALSPHPFLRAHLTNPSSDKKPASSKSTSAPLRANNRTPTESRPPQVNTNSLTHTNGSAVVRLGNTVAVCGIRAEILRVEDIVSASPSQDTDLDLLPTLLVPNLELSTGSTPLLLPGNAPSTLQQTLTTRLRNLLLSSRLVRQSDLTIKYTPSTSTSEAGEDAEEQIKAYWTLYIDTLFISHDGNAFDTAWLAILAALRTTRLPHAFFDEDAEMILCDDDVSTSHFLQLQGLPVPVTFAVFEGDATDAVEGQAGKSWVLSDPDAFEESVCRESVCVVVDLSEGEVAVRRVEKSGGGVVDRGVLRGLVERAGERWRVWREVLEGR